MKRMINKHITYIHRILDILQITQTEACMPTASQCVHRHRHGILDKPSPGHFDRKMRQRRGGESTCSQLLEDFAGNGNGKLHYSSTLDEVDVFGTVLFGLRRIDQPNENFEYL